MQSVKTTTKSTEATRISAVATSIRTATATARGTVPTTICSDRRTNDHAKGEAGAYPLRPAKNGADPFRRGGKLHRHADDERTVFAGRAGARAGCGRSLSERDFPRGKPFFIDTPLRFVYNTFVMDNNNVKSAASMRRVEEPISARPERATRLAVYRKTRRMLPRPYTAGREGNDKKRNQNRNRAIPGVVGTTDCAYNGPHSLL